MIQPRLALQAIFGIALVGTVFSGVLG